MKAYFSNLSKPLQEVLGDVNECLELALRNCKNDVLKKRMKRFLRERKACRENAPKSSSFNEFLQKDSTEVYVDDLVKKQFLLRLKQEKKEREDRLKAELESKTQKLIQESEKQKLLEIQAKEKQKEEKLKHLLDRQEKLSIEKQARLESLEKSNQELRKVSSVKPLFKELEERFQSSFELPELENRKKELARKRQAFAPMNLKEISDHSKNYEELLEIMSSKRKKKKLENNRDSLINSSCQNLYKSKMFEIAQKSDREKEEILQIKQAQKKILTEKSKRYGELVKELFKPVAKINKSLDKVIEVPNKIAPVRRSLPRKSEKDLEKNTSSCRTKSTKVGINRLKRVPSIEEKKVENFDYLAEKRKKRIEGSAKPVRIKNWKDVEDPKLKPQQKLEKIRSQVQLLDNQTKTYELLSGKSGDIYSSQYLNQSYVEAIRAKLAYLNELSNI
jgi:hypothetical protein